MMLQGHTALCLQILLIDWVLKNMQKFESVV